MKGSVSSPTKEGVVFVPLIKKIDNNLQRTYKAIDGCDKYKGVNGVKIDKAILVSRATTYEEIKSVVWDFYEELEKKTLAVCSACNMSPYYVKGELPVECLNCGSKDFFFLAYDVKDVKKVMGDKK